MAYTPFLTQAGATVGRALESRGLRQQKEQQNRLAGSAYMGDPQAMQELMQVNPTLGAQIQEQAQKRKETAEQSQLTKQTAARKEVDELSKNVAKFETYEEAKQYADPIIADILQRYPEAAPPGVDAGFSQEGYAQARQIHGEGAIAGDDVVQSSKIYAGGLVQQTMKSGDVRFVEPEKENLEKIKLAEERGAELQGLRAGERVSATNAQKESAAAFKDMVGVRKYISLYDEGIRLLEKEGADTGPVESMFKSFKAASVELDNVQANMGLNVIQNTTFGSLSADELKFALSATMPQGLNSPELADWMIRKREVQMKLADYLEESAIFLGTPGKGHGIADFLRQKRTKKFTESPAKEAQDSEAAQWAKANPKDPRAIKIMQMQGAQ